MAVSAGALAPSAAGAARDTDALLNELRMILKGRDEHQVRHLIADFVASRRLSHRDVSALLAALQQQRVATVPNEPTMATPEASETDNDRASDEHASAAQAPIDIIAPGSPDSTDDPIEPHAPDDDLAWMFGEEPVILAPRTTDAPVGRALDDLLGDWTRTGGQITRAEVAVLVAKRGLTSAQHNALLDLLEQAGVDLPDASDAQPKRAASKGYEFHGDSVSQYLRAISRYPLINASREVELWSLISDGAVAQQELDAADEDLLTRTSRRRLQTRAIAGRRAHAELVCANLRLVVSVAKAPHYEFSGVEFADRIQDGNLGLMRAADKFDGSKGFKFSTYATWWIKQAIERGIGDRGRPIRIPIHVHEQLQKVRKAVSKLGSRLGREPSLAEISDMTGFEPGKVQWALDLMQPVRSLDALLVEDGDLRLSDVLSCEEERDGRTDPAHVVLHAQFQADLDRILKTLLPERSARIVERRFGLGTGEEETLEGIAADYGVTRERIRQIQSRSLATLRESTEAAELWSYLSESPKAGWSVGPVERTAA